jgi:hypothetical protein
VDNALPSTRDPLPDPPSPEASMAASAGEEGLADESWGRVTRIIATGLSNRAAGRRAASHTSVTLQQISVFDPDAAFEAALPYYC